MAEETGCKFCVGLIVAWFIAVSALMWSSWPHLPLDMSGVDPATISALRFAVARHLVYHLTLLIAPLIVIRLFIRMRSGGGK